MVGVGISVDLKIFLVWFNSPFAVATNFGIYYCTSLDVNPFHDCKNPFSIKYLHLDGTGMNSVACSYYISFASN